MTQLRKAVEKKKEYYIQKLFDAGFFNDSNLNPETLTLSDLEKLLKRVDKA